MIHDEKWSAARIPCQRGRVAVVTGANTGIGYETANVLAARGASVVLAVRDVAKGEHAAGRIKRKTPRADVTVQQLDLSSMDSVRAAAVDLRTAHTRLDLLINNAGVALTPKVTTRDGYELQFATNHLGHFALTGLLLDRLLPVHDSRVVTVTSIAHRLPAAAIHFHDLHWQLSYDRVAAYCQSKLANLLFTYEMNRRLLRSRTCTIAVAAHPGVSDTDLLRNAPVWIRLFLAGAKPLARQSAAIGALATLRAAVDPKVLGGQYFGPSGFSGFKGHPVLAKSSRQSHDTVLQRRLWAVSQDLTGVQFPIY
ncbi:SDR family NAD(P)-dependent oxidoreductase [Streptomyces sp. b94]|uniref:oxidoreductase n=1 Tax=Streptomyces sp. b94 TaxID=1827634 RepID=UPI001B369FED|nr:oxidoreductase [Streptomyces sp. b94]MBQ1101111.1 SDR family NAD(P)-dependent oxidoreductase [Streptomyces sp. b94]